MSPVVHKIRTSSVRSILLCLSKLIISDVLYIVLTYLKTFIYLEKMKNVLELINLIGKLINWHVKASAENI